MLQLERVTKVYGDVGSQVKALEDINLTFRRCEFVSILGPSGCGKTTMLNIIGGLDRYTEGDLRIDGISTKQYKPQDWDTYRNRSIGFVFQSYNLIPHLTVLGNVELALTLSGVGVDIRKKRAELALEKVGLGGQLNKHPNQLSGGQMQRVAIARALVNDPEILLADEPTGALDSTTSVQIMDLLKEIANDRLIIMVTHNAKLAEEYSTRIISLLDGHIVSDTDPVSEDEIRHTSSLIPFSPATNPNVNPKHIPNGENIGPQSLENGEVKRTQSVPGGEIKRVQSVPSGEVKRTQSVPSGEKKGVEDGQYNTTEQSIGKDTRDTKAERKPSKKGGKLNTSMSFLTALKLSFNNLTTKKVRTFMTSFAGSIGIVGIALVLAISNGFSSYVRHAQSDALAGFPLTIDSVSYSMTPDSMMGSMEKPEDKYPTGDKIFSYDSFGKMVHYNNIDDAFIKHVEGIDSALYNSLDFTRSVAMHVMTKTVDHDPVLLDVGMVNMPMMSYSITGWQQIPSKTEFITSQYDVLGSGRIPTEKNELALVVDRYNRLDNTFFDALGLPIDKDKPYTFEDFMNMEFKVIPNDIYYNKPGEKYVPETDLNRLYYREHAEVVTLKIVGILRSKKDATSVLGSGLAYTPQLTTAVLESAKNSKVAQAQKQAHVEGGKTPNVVQGDSLGSMLTEEKYKQQLNILGATSLPSSISIYPIDFASKTKIKTYLSTFNKDKTEEESILYTDLAETVTSSLNTMIDGISYVLVAFAAISLVVSSIMIGIITYVSVIERTKEIGVLRSLGARKKDVARVFNAETLIIGFTAGLIGVLVAALLTFPINWIISALAPGLVNIASLAPLHAFILVIISMALTLISGLVPSSIAAKKDPVVALRTE